MLQCLRQHHTRVAGDSEGIIGLHVSQSSFDNSSNSLGVCLLLLHVHVLLLLLWPGVCLLLPPACAPALRLLHMRAPHPCMNARDSWSDTGRNSRSTGGLLPVCKSTSYSLEVGMQGPTRRRGTKGGVSRSRPEDLRPVSEVEAGGKIFGRPAVCTWGQVAGSLPRRQPGTGTRQVKGSVVTRVSWIRSGHQAINGLDEGVWNHTQDCLGYARARLSVFMQVWTWSSSQTTN